MTEMTSDIHLALLQSDDEITTSFPIVSELRLHLKQQEYLALVREMESHFGFRLLGLFAGDRLEAVAGFRISRSLAWGKYLYVDDLVTTAGGRSMGYGALLMHWLLEHARQNRCTAFHLDSGVQRHAAHRFYLRERMDITAYHFEMALPAR